MSALIDDRCLHARHSVAQQSAAQSLSHEVYVLPRNVPSGIMTKVESKQTPNVGSDKAHRASRSSSCVEIATGLSRPKQKTLQPHNQIQLTLYNPTILKSPLHALHYLPNDPTNAPPKLYHRLESTLRSFHPAQPSPHRRPQRNNDAQKAKHEANIHDSASCSA
jgi:hypothetical protein